jgi:hypothetical protein
VIKAWLKARRARRSATVVTVDGRAYPVTLGEDGQYRATDGSNEFSSNTPDGLRQAMTGMAGNPRVTGNTFTQNYYTDGQGG